MAASWDDITAELFALPPDRFTRARDAQASAARRAGDRGLAERVRALHRPSPAAHALNLFARSRPDQVALLLDLGRELREAQASWAGPRLRGLTGRRAQLVTQLAGEAVHLAADAGQKVSGTARAEVEQSLRAALADEDAGRRFAEGSLERALEEPTGFGSLDGTPPPPPSPPSSGSRRKGAAEAPQAARKHTAEKQAAEKHAAEGAVRQAGRDLRTAQQRRERAASAAARAQRQERAARDRVDKAREALRQAEEEAESAGAELSAREAEREDAEQQVSRAERALAEADEAREALEDPEDLEDPEH